ncbi:transmembrane protein 26-like [Salarias fasciatus]|uniref:transmembrane protein 26-like n=1 Tax=Salarias fasciatus TaxID=181472 RepID=UPI0011764B67|nr:transmembrane protein 26-like [Salarias fasciatus]
MWLVHSVYTIITRALFILVALFGVWRVTWVKKDPKYWFLSFLFLPLVVEMMIILKNRKGKGCKWFSPPILLFLISIIPSIWILELHHQKEKANEPKCRRLDLWESAHALAALNKSMGNLTYESYLEQVLSSVCSKDWILALHQILLILLIVGKWLLPLRGGITKDELSQLLLIFVGTAADILEFTSETLSDVKVYTPELVYTILAVWTWSMLQFPLHLSVINSKPDSEKEDEDSPEVSLWSKHSTDIWSVMEALFIQNGPFLVVRLTVMIYFKLFGQMIIFFAIKNFLVVILSFYRLIIICDNFRQSRRVAGRDSQVP